MKRLRKFLTVSVMVLSVVAMSGLGAINVQAAASAGDLIKMAGNTSVYYLGSDGKRYVFPNSTTYFSWYPDFSGVITIPSAELQSYPLGGNVTMRAGTKLVKITTDPAVYAVEPNGMLRKIQSEAQASSLYGVNWNKRIVDVPDAFFTNYTVGAVLPSGAIPAGSLVKNVASADVYYYDGTNYRVIASETAFNANKFQWASVITAPSTVSSGGAAISGSESGLLNVAQNGGVGPIVTGSGLMLSLSSMTPAAVSVPQNGSRVPMAKLNLSAANDGSVSVNSLTVKRIGLSTYSQVDKVWAEQNGVIVASKKSMNSNDESILVFSPALVVPAGQTISIDLLVGLTSASGTIGLSVVSASAVSATAASVTGAFPINSNLMSPIAYSVANLSVTNTSTGSPATLKVGDENVEMGHFTVEFNGTAKDVVINSLMLKNNGVEDISAITDLYIEYNGSKVSSAYTVDGRFVTFYFGNGLELLKDDGSKVLYLKGSVSAKEQTADNSVNFVLNKSTDLTAYEKATGFGVNVYNDVTGTTAADNLSLVAFTIDAGALSVSKKSTSPAATTIIKGSDHVMLLANIRADEAITADGLNVVYASVNASSTQFENVRVYLNSVLLDSFDPAVTTTATVALDSTLTLNKGDNEVKVMAKAKSTAVAGSDIKFSLVGTSLFTSMNPEYVVSGNTVTETPGGSATGGIFTVQGASLVVVRNDGYAAAKVIVRGVTDASIGKFSVQATNDAIKVNSVSFSKLGTTTDTSISDAKLFVDGVQVGNTTDYGSSGVTFSSLNLSIAKDATKSFELKMSVDSAAAVAGTNGISGLLTVNATDSRGTAVTGDTTESSTTFAISAGGTLLVELGGNTPQAGLLAAKSAEQEVAQYKFTAIDDSASITELNFINQDPATTSAVATSSADARIAQVRLYDDTTLVASFVPVSGAGMFTITNGILVPSNTAKTLSVRVVLNDIVNDSAATDKDIKLKLTTVDFKSSDGTLTEAQAENDLANNFRVRKTVPTIALQALPTTVLTAGDQVVSKFTVTADANGDVTVGRIVLLWATSTNSTILGLSTSTGGVKVNGAIKNVASVVNNASTTITLNFNNATPEVIPAGQSKTFEVLATLGVSGQGAESVTTKIVEDAAYVTSSGATLPTYGNFIWSDGANVSTYTWANATRVPGLTTATQVLSK